MKAAHLDKARELLRRRDNLSYYLTHLSTMSHAYVTIQAPRSWPGNDRDELSIEIPLDSAREFIARELDTNKRDLEMLGVEL